MLNCISNKIQEEIESLKRKRRLSPNSIHINLDPTSVDKMYISHSTSKFDLTNPLVSKKSKLNKKKGKKFNPSGSYASSVKNDEEGGN